MYDPLPQGEPLPPVLLLFGGCFNPPHAGHMQVALEAAGWLKPERFFFVPCAVPPHKNRRVLLPLEFRCRLLQAAIADTGAVPGFFDVCAVEGEREGPSYTADTLRLLAARYPGMRLAFMLGCDTYEKMGLWPEYRRIPDWADMVVLSKGGRGEQRFAATSRALWPEAEPEKSAFQVFRLPGGGKLLFLSLPEIAISASNIRMCVLRGVSPKILTSPRVAALLCNNEGLLRKHWLEEKIPECGAPMGFMLT